MLSKKILVGIILSLACIAGFTASWPVIEGTFEDGTKMLYQCQGKYEGKIPFLIELPDGHQYKGIIVCGTEI